MLRILGAAGLVAGLFAAQSLSATDFDSIELEYTVGIDPSECATADEIALDADSAEVIYCWRMTNHSGRTLVLHDLVEESAGVLFSDLYMPLASGEGMFYTMSASLQRTTRSVSRWAAFGGSHFSCDSAQATVYLNDMQAGEWLFRGGFEDTLDCKDVFD